jgi:hypothetical protein
MPPCHHYLPGGEEVIVADKVKDFTVRMSEEEHRALRVYCALTHRSMNDVVTSSVRDFLAGAAQREAFEAALESARDEYREALDKLAQ